MGCKESKAAVQAAPAAKVAEAAGAAKAAGAAEASGDTEFRYSEKTDKEIYEHVIGMGYKWVNTTSRFFLLMNSIRKVGFGSGVDETLMQKTTLDLYRNGPDTREAWIFECRELMNKRRPPHDYLNDKRHWCEKLKTSLEVGKLISDCESSNIYDKWLLRQYVSCGDW